MPNINEYRPRSGRIIREDGTIVNEADGLNNDGSKKVQLTGSNVVLKTQDYTTTTSVAAGNSSSISVVPPAGKGWKIKSVRYTVGAVSGATSGSQRLSIHPNDSYIRLLETRDVSYTTGIYYLAGQLLDDSYSPISGAVPSSAEAQIMQIKDLIVTNNTPLVLGYTNLTDAAQDGTRSIKVLFEEINI